jgi:hypothetical protein
MKHSILNWNGISTGMLVVLCIIGVIMNYIIFYTLDNNDQKIQDIIDKIQYYCLYKCKNNCNGLTNLRDDDYFMGVKTTNVKKCFFTVWELSHLLFHTFLGYFYNIYISVGTSVFFEIYEHYKYNCGSYLDLMWNFLGFLIGSYIRYGTLSI